MTPRRRVIRALEFDRPDRAPRDLWALPGILMLRGAELQAVFEKFPNDFEQPVGMYGPSQRARGMPNEIGVSVDEWGCEFTVMETGVVGEVKHPPLADWSRLEGWAPPWELLDGADVPRINRACKKTDNFVIGGTHVRPFERMQFLRGSENLLMDLLARPPEFERLRALIHEFNLRDMEMWAGTDVDAISFMDDWGAQNALLIDPRLWREIFKPMYKDYCDICRGAGKYLFFHSDGHISDIYGDLIEIGVSAVNSQLFCMDIEEVARQHKGRITFWGEICRQHILPFGSTGDVREAVRRVRRALDDGTGGVIAQCEWGLRDPRENIEAVFETWMEKLSAL
ncbi:MAG TPA: uroporphyrinogen decarboxylase family protein [Candidatus Bathyarchaeia archaeon]|nr:uroporphyrinogen decarboxylase family protein [Candidatus Bathyarchaeia archaeon]